MKDFTVGFVGGATSVLGPGEIAAVFKVGSVAAGRAAELAVAGVAKTALKDGAEDTLKAATQKLMQHALSSGAPGIKEKQSGNCRRNRQLESARRGARESCRRTVRLSQHKTQRTLGGRCQEILGHGQATNDRSVLQCQRRCRRR